MDKIEAKARVQIIVEIDLTQPWGPECPIGQLHKQAAAEAKTSIISALAKSMPRARISGEPKVMGIITTETT